MSHKTQSTIAAAIIFAGLALCNALGFAGVTTGALLICAALLLMTLIP